MIKGQSALIFRLGVGTETKVKREQFVILREYKRPQEFVIMKRLLRVAKAESRLFPDIHEYYGRLLKWAQVSSARAGFAWSPQARAP